MGSGGTAGWLSDPVRPSASSIRVPNLPAGVLPTLHQGSRLKPGDWMISLDLQDTYLQVPVHHDLRRFLRFVVDGKPFQFRVLCFGLTTAPQVFTRIMAPVSAILHRHGVRMLRYLDDWLILASSEIACLQSRDRLLAVCTELGIQVNLTKSSLVPSQSIVYLGMEIHSLPFIARPTPA